MSYACYLAGVRMPTPAKLTMKIKGKNQTLTLLDEGEINFLRAAGLTELTVPFVFPMLTDRRGPAFYLSLLETLKTSKKPTRFILVRRSPDGRRLYDTNMAVAVESYSVVEDAAAGLDVAVDVSLKQWRSYGTKTFEVEEPEPPAETPAEAASAAQPEPVPAPAPPRETASAPAARTYTVQKGDTLWAIAARFYGSGAQYGTIFSANSGQISNPNLIYPGQVLTIP